MGIADVSWMVSIVGGAGYLLYRSIWKKTGLCQGCANAGCPRREVGVPAALLGCWSSERRAVGTAKSRRRMGESQWVSAVERRRTQ